MLSSEKFWKMIPDGTLEAAELPYVKCYNKHSPDNNKVVQVIERIDPIKGNWITEIFYLKL